MGSDRRQRCLGTEGFTGGSFYVRKKIRLEFPLSTKNRKSVGELGLKHVSLKSNKHQWIEVFFYFCLSYSIIIDRSS